MVVTDSLDALQELSYGLLVSSAPDIALERSLQRLPSSGPARFNEIVQNATSTSFDHARAIHLFQSLLTVIAAGDFPGIITAYLLSSRDYRAHEIDPVRFQRNLTVLVATSALVYAYRRPNDAYSRGLISQSLQLLLPPGASIPPDRLLTGESPSAKKLLEVLAKIDREVAPLLDRAGLGIEGLGPVRQMAAWLWNVHRKAIDDTSVYALAGPLTANDAASHPQLELTVYKSGAGRFYADPYDMRTRPATNSFCNALATAWESSEARKRLGDDVDVCWSVHANSLSVLDGPSMGGLMTTALRRLRRCLFKLPQTTNWAMSATVDSSGKLGPVEHLEEKVRSGLNPSDRTIVLVSLANQEDVNAIALSPEEKERVLTIESVDEAVWTLRQYDRRHHFQNMRSKTLMAACLCLFTWWFWPSFAPDRDARIPDPLPGPPPYPTPDPFPIPSPPEKFPRVSITYPTEGETVSEPVITVSGELSSALPHGYSLYVLGFSGSSYFTMEPAVSINLGTSRWLHDNVRLSSTGEWRVVVIAKPDHMYLPSLADSLPDGVRELASVNVQRALPLEIAITKPNAEEPIGTRAYSELQGTFSGSPDAVRKCRIFGQGPDRRYYILSEHSPIFHQDTWYLKPIHFPASGTWTLYVYQLDDGLVQTMGSADTSKPVFDALFSSVRVLATQTVQVSFEGDPVSANSGAVAMDEFYIPSGFFGHTADLKKYDSAEGGTGFICTWSDLQKLDPVKDGARLFDDNEWDQKYLESGELNPRQAEFLGCMYLRNGNWGRTPGGMNFAEFRPTAVSWEARAIGSPLTVAFQHGGFGFLWDESKVKDSIDRYQGHKIKPPFPCSMPFRQLLTAQLTTEWQTFTVDLQLDSDELERVLLPFGWKVDPQKPGTTSTFEIRNLKWINNNYKEPDDAAKDPILSIK